MNFSAYFHLVMNAFTPFWGELVGALLMAIMLNIVINRGAQGEAFKFFRLGLYTLILSLLFQITLTLLPTLAPKLAVSHKIPIYTRLIFMALVTAFFIAGAIKNIHFYFSAPILISILTSVFSAVSIMSTVYGPIKKIGLYLPPIYLILGFFVAGCSFYINIANRRNKALRTIGNGFFILAIGTCYQVFNIIHNSQQVILLCYTIATVLALAAQIQFLIICNSQLEDKILAEKKSKKETWEISPFPIMISRLRDDHMIYMNPVALKMLEMSPEEVSSYTMTDYFLNPKRKEDLILQLQRTSTVNSFEVQIHHPKLNNVRWIDITTRTTDLDDEVVLYTTFKDITDQKEHTRLLKEQASTDPLTGLYNRRQFEILAYQGLQGAKRYRHPYTIAMLDIDFFKKVNDTYGHEAGDLVLQNLSKTLVRTLRKADIVARYGGEEFVIFLTNTTPSEGRIALEHVRDAVSQMVISSGNNQISITISIGLSDMQTFNLQTLIKQADDSLYYSKQHGRNRVTLYQDLLQASKTPSPSLTQSDNKETFETKPTINSDKKPLYPPMPTSGEVKKAPYAPKPATGSDKKTLYPPMPTSGSDKK